MLRRFAVASVLVLATSLPAIADAISEVKALAQELDRAAVAKDAAVIERSFADDFIFVRGSGRVTDKASMVGGFTAPGFSVEPWVVEHPFAIELGPDAVIVGGEVTMKGIESNEPFTEHFRYSDTWKRRNGQWQIVYTQITMIPAPAATPPAQP